MRIPALVLTFIANCSFAAAAHSVPRPELPFHLTPRGGVIVRVDLDDGRAIPFLLDTGSNGSAISESLVRSLRLGIVAKTTVASAIGQKIRPVTRIEHLVMGSVSVNDVLATVMPDDDFALPDADGDRVQGIVGQDVLAALRYTIDYRARRVVLFATSREVPRHAAVLTLEPRDDRFLVVLPQGRSTLRLVPDSGSEGLVLFQRENGATSPITFTGRATLSSVTGSGEAMTGRLEALRIGATTLTDVPVVIVEHVPAAQTADGLLPLHIFARVTFNGPERELVIETQ
jgi:predicted aspartyl protease